MSQNEKEPFKMNIMFCRDNICYLENCENTFQSIFDNINLIKQFDSPDLYLKIKDEVIGIENFKFSAYKTIRKKGDYSKKEQEEFFLTNENEFEKCEKGLLYKEKYLKSEKSVNDYEKNFIAVFNNHYQKVKKYKENLKKFSKKIKIFFYIEDITTENNEIKYNNRNILYNFTMNKNILDFLKDKKEIDGIIFRCNDIEKSRIYCLKLNGEDIEILMEKNKQYFNLEFEKREVKLINCFWRF